jgi:hypothetical protein
MEVSGQLHATAALHPVPTEWEAGWASETIWTKRRGEKFPAPAGNWSPVTQPLSPVTILTELPQLPRFMASFNRFRTEWSWETVWTSCHWTSLHVRTFNTREHVVSWPSMSVSLWINCSLWNGDSPRTNKRYGRIPKVLIQIIHRDQLGTTQPPIQWVPGALPLGVKRPGREADFI